ncbi:MAG: hypothetical protein IJT94_06720 [Oscillibacter sp.]|nr:hypothetical protein [Oscillibacter sp.]
MGVTHHDHNRVLAAYLSHMTDEAIARRTGYRTADIEAWREIHGYTENREENRILPRIVNIINRVSRSRKRGLFIAP